MGWPLWVQILIDVLHHYRVLTTDTPWLVHIQCPHNRHPVARPQGQHTGCPLWVQILINISHHYRIFTTDTPWPTCKNNTCGIPCEFKFWLIYITTGSSQQTLHGLAVRAMHWVPPVSSISEWCTTSLQDPHNRHPMARPQGQHMGHLLRVEILIDALYHYRNLTADTPRIVREDNTWGVLCVQILINISLHSRTFTTDTPWPTCKNNTCGVPCEFKF